MEVNNDDDNGKYGSSAEKKRRLSPQSYMALLKHAAKEIKTSGTSDSETKFSTRSVNVTSAVSPGKQRLLEEQKCLHQDLRPVMTKLFEILGLKEEIKLMAERFLKYVINNHRVTREPESILQAFEISVCWVAASLLGENIDQKHSLILAREHLNFSCDDNEADYISSKMRSLSELFIKRSGDLKGLRSPRDLNSGTKILTRETVSKDGLKSDLFSQQKITDNIKEQKLLQTSSVSKGVLTEKDVPRENKIHENCPELLENLIQRQPKEVLELKKLWEERKAELEKDHNLDSLITQAIHPTLAARMEKLKILNMDYAKKCQELDSEMTRSFKALKARHQIVFFLEEVNTASSLSAEFDSVALNKLPSVDEAQVSDDPGNLRVNQITVGDPSSTPGVQGNLPGIAEGDSVKQVVESFELPAVLVDKNASMSDNDDNSNYSPKQGRSDEVISADSEVTLDNVEVVRSTLDSHEMNSAGSLEVERHDDDSLVLQRSSGNHINEELASQMASRGRCEGATTFGDGAVSSQLLTPRSMPQSHAIASGSNPMATDQCLANASNSAMVNQVNAEMMSSRQDCVIESGDPQGTAEEPGVDEAVQIVPSVVPDGDGRSHPSFPSSSESQHQSGQAVPTLVAPDERSRPSLPSTSEPHHQPAQHNPLAPSTLHLSNPSRNPTITDLPQPGLPHHPAARSLPPVRGHSAPVGLPLRPQLQSVVLPDPIQNVLEKIQKQKDQCRTNYMEARSKLDADRDKEIEDVVAQIRKKYELKVQEAEASFSQQEPDYAGMHALVVMNKILAEEFRSKCIDFRAARAALFPPIQQQQQRRHPIHISSTGVRPPLLFSPAHSYSLPTATRTADHLQAHAIPRQRIRPPPIRPHGTYSGPQNCSVSATCHPAPVPVPPSMSEQPLRNPNSSRPSTTLPPLSEIARHLDSWNLSAFDTSKSQQNEQPVSGPASTDATTVEQQPPQSVTASRPDAAILDVVCLSDDDE